MAISSNCSKLRRVLFNRNDGRLGHTGHNKSQSDPFGPLAPIFNILLQLLRVLVRDISVRVADPELFQVPRHTILSKMRDVYKRQTPGRPSAHPSSVSLPRGWDEPRCRRTCCPKEEHPPVPSNPQPSGRAWRVALKPCLETVSRAPAICPAQHDKCATRRRECYRP